MPIAVLALLGLLAVSPSPPPSTLSVSPASTCDSLIVGIFNNTDDAITLTPTVDAIELDPLTVIPGDNVPFTVPGEDGRQLSLTTEKGVQLGPWVWAEPADCDEVLPPGAAIRDPGPELQELDPKQTAAVWVFVLGFICAAIGVVGMVSHRLKRNRYVDRTALVATRIGKHRAAPEPLVEKMRRSLDGRRISVRRY